MTLPNNVDVLEEIVSRGYGKFLNGPASTAESRSDDSSTETDNDFEQTNETLKDIENGPEDEVESDCTSNVSIQPTGGKIPVFWWNWYKEQVEASRGRYKLVQMPEVFGKLSVDVTAVLSPEYFILQLCEVERDPSDSGGFFELQRTLQLEGESQEPVSAPFFLKECISKFSDGVWYRAVILKEGVKDGRKTVCVQYVDYGNMEEKFIEEVRQMKDEWFDVPTQAVLCRIAGYKFAGLVTLSSAKSIISHVLRERSEPVAHVKGRDGDILIVELCDEAGELLYQELIANGFYQLSD